MGADWYYVKNGERHGPVLADDVRRMAHEGQLTAEDIVWSEGMTNWMPLGNVPELLSSQTDQPIAVAAVHHAPDPRAYVAHVPTPAPAYDPTLAYRASPQTGPVVASERALEMLRQTRPWARVVAILLIIGAALCILMGCFGGLALFVAAQDRWVGWLMLLYLPLALLYLIPATYLNRYASRITATLMGRRELDLEEALAAQKSFWKFVGITIIAVVGLSILALLVGMLANFR